MTVSTPTAMAIFDADPALLTLGVCLYAAITIMCIGIGVNAARWGRRRRAWIMATVVTVLVIAGVIVAILSSVK